MTTINEQEMKKPRGRPKKNRAVPTQVKQPKATASKTPELFVVMTPMDTSEWNKTFSKDSANTQPMEVDEHQQANQNFERSKQHKIEGDSKHYQAAMHAFIKDNLSNGRTKMKFEFVIK